MDSASQEALENISAAVGDLDLPQQLPLVQFKSLSQTRQFSKESLSPTHDDIVNSLEDQLVIEQRNIQESAMKAAAQLSVQSSAKREMAQKLIKQEPPPKVIRKFNPPTQEEGPKVSTTQQDEAIKEPTPKPVKEKPQQTTNTGGQIILNTREVRYPVIKRVARKTFGWKLSKCKKPGEEDQWDVLWTDEVFSAEKLQGMKPHQVINHFPAMYLIALKHNLAKYLKIMQKAFPEDFKFFPKTWVTPYEFFDLNNFIAQRKQQGQGLTLIVKPQNQCQGKGIFLTRRVEDIPRDKCHVVQQYQQQPYLIDGRKFDLRVYVLVTQVDPHLTCFMYADGLGRFATEQYAPPKTTEACQNLFMHLTNYAINKNSEKFTAESEGEFKKQLREMYEQFGGEGHDVGGLKGSIEDMVIKTLLSVQPQLAHSYNACKPNNAGSRSCFELLGFDILIDKKFKPWLLEVNHAPSFNDDTEVDKAVKTGLLTDTLRLLNIKWSEKQRILNKQRNEIDKKKLNTNSQQEGGEDSEEEHRLTYEEYQEQNLGEYKKIYPFPHGEGESQEVQERWQLYEGIIAKAKEVWVKQTGVNNQAKEAPGAQAAKAGQLVKDQRKPFGSAQPQLPGQKKGASTLEKQPNPYADQGKLKGQSAPPGGLRKISTKEDPKLSGIREEDDEYGFGQSGRDALPTAQQICAFQQEHNDDDFDDLLGQNSHGYNEISPQQVTRVLQQQQQNILTNPLQAFPVQNQSFTVSKPPMPLNASQQQKVAQVKTLRRVSTGASTSSTTFSSHSQRRQNPPAEGLAKPSLGSKSIDSKQPRLVTKRVTVTGTMRPKQSLNQVNLDPFSPSSSSEQQQPSSNQSSMQRGMFPQISGTRSNQSEMHQVNTYMVPTKQTAKVKQASRALNVPNQVLEFSVGGAGLQPVNSQQSRSSGATALGKSGTNRENDLLNDLTAAFHSQNDKKKTQKQSERSQPRAEPMMAPMGLGISAVGITSASQQAQAQAQQQLPQQKYFLSPPPPEPQPPQIITQKTYPGGGLPLPNGKRTKADFKTGPEAVRAIAMQASSMLSGKVTYY